MGIMTLGPAYGLQLHAELCGRAPHRARTNVGQIYATLERLVAAGTAQKSGATSDGFPLYSLTDKGQTQAQSWLVGETVMSFSEWSEILDHIMIARSLSDSALERVIGVYERILTRDPMQPALPANTGQTMVDLAQQHIINAALAWLGDIRRDLSRRLTRSEDPATDSRGAECDDDIARGYLPHRPKRGRPALA